MEWNIGNVTIPNQVVVAPMAGVTNSAFRIICKEYGAGLVVCEMISDRGIMYKNKKNVGYDVCGSQGTPNEYPDFWWD